MRSDALNEGHVMLSVQKQKLSNFSTIFLYQLIREINEQGKRYQKKCFSTLARSFREKKNQLMESLTQKFKRFKVYVTTMLNLRISLKL